MKITRNQPAPKTQSAKARVTPKGILELKFFLNGLLIANKSFSETVSWWHTKNEKKLNAELKKCQAEDKVIDNEYVEKNDRGEYKLWDKIDGGFTCYYKETAEGGLFVDANGKPMPDLDKEMHFFVPEEKRAEYDQKKIDFAANEREIHAVQIDRSLLSQLNIPTMGSASQAEAPRKLNRELFYDTLVMPDADDLEVDETVLEESDADKN